MNGSSEADCKRNDGFGLIRTGDPRNVKTEDLGLLKHFLWAYHREKGQ